MLSHFLGCSPRSVTSMALSSTGVHPFRATTSNSVCSASPMLSKEKYGGLDHTRGTYT